MKICFLEPDYKSDNTLQYLFHYKPYISNGRGTEQIFDNTKFYNRIVNRLLLAIFD